MRLGTCQIVIISHSFSFIEIIVGGILEKGHVTVYYCNVPTEKVDFGR